ncbi:MAG: HAD family phosphatase [Flavobacteriaceae bacterium]|nr:HAD family phosphatase [Flavobacteriaceae bacterium]
MIKNIIFDFGDIFINLDKPATLKALANYGVNQISNHMIRVYQQYEKGLISTDEFVEFFQKEFNLERQQIIDAWNAILLDFPKERLSFLKELSKTKKYRLFLLSNTNELHINWVKNSVGSEFYNEFKNCFEQFYLSHEIHLRKPDLEIYEFVLSENKLKREETLFIDDAKENTDVAKLLGIKTWNLNPGKEEVSQLFSKNLLV